MTSRITCVPGERDPLRIEKPRFFPGQTLSDKDLGAIVCWTEQRLRLHPTCGNWGVVCGLAVGVDPQHADRVTVGSGYGFDREGGLCVVDKRVEADLPCSPCGGCGDEGELNRQFPASTVAYRSSDLRVYDALLAVKDCPQQKALALSMDGRRHCEETRLKTSAQLVIVPAFAAPVAAEPAIQFLDQLLGEKKKLCELLKGAIDWDPFQFSSEMNAWLSKVLKSWPALQLPWPAFPESWGTLDEARAHLSWLVFAFRRLRACPPAATDPAIPLARIWTVCSGNRLRVIWIDDAAPHRRTLHCGRAGFRLRDWIGESLNSAKADARIWGITVESKPLGNPTFATVDALKSQVDDEIKLGVQVQPDNEVTDAPVNRVTAIFYSAPEYTIANGQVAVTPSDRVFAWVNFTPEGAQSAGAAGEGAATGPAIDLGAGGAAGI